MLGGGRALVLFLLLGTACRGPAPERPHSFSSGLAALPNLGPWIGYARAYARDAGSERALEVRLLQQFLDDEDFASDGNPGAGDLTAVSLGWLARSAPGAPRHVVVRAGLQTFEARGTPNLVELPGRYVGGYLGLGFLTDLGPHLSLGPEFVVLPSWGQGDFVVLPRIAFGLTWRP